MVATPPQYAEAVRFSTAAVALRPDSKSTHVNLAYALSQNGKVDEAYACCRKAIELKPGFEAYVQIGGLQSLKGQLDEAIASVNKAIELNPKFAVAHYNLACYSAMIALGTGEIADSERVRLRRQALDSLRVSLSLYTDEIDNDILLDGKYSIRNLLKHLSHWYQDPDLISIRGTSAIAKLPDDEREAFTQLWTDVATVIQKASTALGLPWAVKKLGLWRFGLAHFLFRSHVSLPNRFPLASCPLHPLLRPEFKPDRADTPSAGVEGPGID